MDEHAVLDEGRPVGGPPELETRRPRVLLAVRDLAFHQEILDFLERDPRFGVVGTATEPDTLFRLEAATSPDVTLVCPSLAREVRHPASASKRRNLLVVGEEMSVPLLRDAIDAGARGVFAWPEERDELARTIGSIRSGVDEMPTARGRVIAVFGPRGGAGTTFLACHLAASLADQGRRCALVDLDRSFADVTLALGIAGQDTRTISDLAAVSDELAPDQVEAALYRHPRGFSALLAPLESEAAPDLPAGLYGGAIALLALAYEAVILHAPRCLDHAARLAIGMADEVVMVVSPDLFSLYSARRAVDALGLYAVPSRCRVVINPSARGELGMRDIERVLGVRPAGAVRFDPSVGRAQGRGELLPAGSRRAGRDVAALARLLVPAGRSPAPDGRRRSER